MTETEMPAAEFSRLVSLLQGNRYPELERVSRSLTERYPLDGRGWQLLGVSFLVREMGQEALPWLRRAGELMPDHPSIWDNLGLAYLRIKNYAEADASFRRSTRLQPDRLTAWLNWSTSACEAGDADQAEYCARQALQLNPGLADAWLNLGNALADLGRAAEAEAAYQRALALRPNWHEALLSLGAVLEGTGRLREAAACCQELLAMDPANWRAHANLGRVLANLGETSRAIASYRQAVRLQPDAVEAHSGLLYHLLHAEDADPAEVFAEHCRFGDLVEGPFRSTWGGHANDPDPDRRLRLGIVSGDLREHAVAFFILPLIEAFDQGALSIHFYANQPGEDAVSATLKRHADQWLKVIGMSDDQLAERIRADRIDILADLSGHTALNRLPVFARKPAPVQLSWLGYPGTTGLRAIDYRPIYRAGLELGILDRQVTEKLVYLPRGSSFQPYADAPPVNPLPALERGYVTYGSLNRPGKLGKRLIEAWARILTSVPGSKLIIGAIGDGATEARLRAEFAQLGIGADRLEFHPRLPLREYLELHHRIDILLDSFPYAGGTTSLHAIWMGVPVVALEGDTLQQRAGRGVMTRAGLPEWVAGSIDDYVAKAVAAAGDLDALAALRLGMRERLSEDVQWHPADMARHLETAFREMWRRWCAGLPVERFEVKP